MLPMENNAGRLLESKFPVTVLVHIIKILIPSHVLPITEFSEHETVQIFFL